MDKRYNSICNRKDCFGFNKERENNCNCLQIVYKDCSKCPFFKKKKDVDLKKIEDDLIRYGGRVLGKTF